ncbi:hypothetical protein HDU76_001432 [Blyttiomyces sp. JEL0837]|nr:hypothetical protein HDU76_001432 [Blyttiomyces sp. JEL0837]
MNIDGKKGPAGQEGLQFPKRKKNMLSNVMGGGFKTVSEKDKKMVPFMNLSGAYLSYRWGHILSSWSGWKKTRMVLFRKKTSTSGISWIGFDFDDGAIAVKLSDNDNELQISGTNAWLKLENEGGLQFQACLEFDKVYQLQAFAETWESFHSNNNDEVVIVANMKRKKSLFIANARKKMAAAGASAGVGASGSEAGVDQGRRQSMYATNTTNTATSSFASPSTSIGGGGYGTSAYGKHYGGVGSSSSGQHNLPRSRVDPPTAAPYNANRRGSTISYNNPARMAQVAKLARRESIVGAPMSVDQSREGSVADVYFG